jgi:ribosome biogenesis GTPase
LSIERYGWSRELDEAFAPLRAEGLSPARVVVQQRGIYTVEADDGERSAEPSGRLRHEADEGGLPVAGDWVGLRGSRIEAVLPRRTAFVRKAAGEAAVQQVVAANFDLGLVVQALPDDVNPRRLERYVTAVWESGATPVVVLTKTDLADDVTAASLEVEASAPGVSVHAISSVTGEGVEAIRALLAPNRTAVLVGSSGVGKSTLVNRLLGEERQAVAEVRDDGRGRHTTTHRELLPVPGGGLLLDTPGMRELGLWADEESLDAAFDDVVELAAGCRFSDCTHVHEPGCAVLAAVEDGRLEPARLESFHKLGRELAYLERRTDARLQAEEKRKWRAVQMEYRRQTRDG